MKTINNKDLQNALDVLGLKRNPLDGGTRSREFLIGSLLAIAENLAYEGLDRADLGIAQDGYMTVLAYLSGHDPAALARGWAVLLNSRLNRTAVELNEATEGDGRMFTDVAGPAMLVASNILYALNHGALDQTMIQNMMTTAEGNITKTVDAFAALKKSLRELGFKLD